MTTPDHRFFVTGGSLPADNPSYVERKADRDLYEALQLCEFCYVLTARQMGKSSLMVRTAARLREAGVRVVALDLTAIGQNVVPEQWYYSLLCRLGEQVGLESALDDFWLDHERLGPLRRFMAALEQVVLPGSTPLVVFIDEIDAVRSLPFPTDEFFAAIRECYNRRSENPALRQLTFCLLGTAAPTDLIRDTRMTPFNIGQRIELTDFSEPEAVRLAVGLEVGERGAPGRPAGAARSLLKRILYWTGGHPYLTQRLCQAVAANAADTTHPPRFTTQQADRWCEDLFLARSAQEKDDNLIFVRERLLRSDVDLVALLELYGRVRRGKPVLYDVTDPLCSLLRLSGIARVSERPGRAPRLVVRNRIYARVFDARWVAGRMPDAEVWRQRAAYRRGLTRATALAAVVVALIGALAVTALGLADDRREALIEARRERDAAADLLYASQMNLAHLSQEDQYVRAWRLLELHRPRPGSRDRRDFVWRYLWRLCRSQDRFTFPRRAADVSSVAFSADGKVLAAGGADGDVQVWDAAGMTMLTRVKAHEGSSAVAISPNGRLLASMGTDDGTLKLWDLTTRPVGLRLQLPGFRRQWTRVLFTPDGKTLIAGSDSDRIQLWDIRSGQRTAAAHRTIPVPAAGPLALSADGTTLAVSGGGTDASRITFWDIGGREVHRLPLSLPPEGLVQSVAFSPDGRRVVTGATTPVLWDVSTATVLRRLLGHRGVVLSTEFSPDGTLLASGGMDGTVRLWDPVSGGLLAVLNGHTSRVTSLAFSPRGDTLASTSGDGTTRLWDTDVDQLRQAELQRRPAEILSAGRDSVRAIALSPDGELLAEARLRALSFWNVSTGTAIHAPLPEESAPGRGPVLLRRGLAFSPDGKVVATGGGDGVIRLWEVRGRRLIGSLRGHPFSVSHLGFAAGGILVSGNGGAAGGVPASIRFWDLASRKLLGTVAGDPRLPLAPIAMSPDGRTVAAGNPDRQIVLWDTASRRKLATFDGESGATSLAFSPDYGLLAVGHREGSVNLWDRASGKLLRRLQGHVGPVLALAFTSDSKTLASGGMDSTVRLWNPAIDQEEATLTGHGGWVWSLAFSPDDNLLVSGSPDGTIRFWRAAPFTETDAPSRGQSEYPKSL